jgi:D-alanyl-D-alanine dipeptidase
MLALALAACSAPAAQTPTPTPSAASTPVATPTAEPSPSPSPTPEMTPTPEPTPTPCVKLSDPTSTLKVRSGPGTNTEKLGELRDGDPVTILERGDVWHKIEYNGSEAYVFAAYITNLPVYYAYVPELSATVNGKTYVSKMVDVRSVVPDIKIWLTFASQDNVMGKVLYPAGACLLQENTALKLAAAAELFAKDGYRIRLYDGYRPYSVSEYLYSQIRDARFVANPKKRPSKHNRGAAVDITLERIDTGEQIPMPSFMHTFNISSYRELPDIYAVEAGSEEYNTILAKYPEILDYPRRSSKAINNMKYMSRIMKSCGFSTISTEWWHFNDTDWKTFMILDYDLAADVQWIAAEDYDAFLAAKAAEGPLTTLPGYVVWPGSDEVDGTSDSDVG